MSDEEAQEEPAKVQEGGEPDPLTVVLDRLETINLTLFQIDQRLQEVEKPPLPRSELKELDSRRNSHEGLNISQFLSFTPTLAVRLICILLLVCVKRPLVFSVAFFLVCNAFY